eukprot:TRINITY_DN5332_c0_g1_i4.p1 TRINITY_DN5332_c0_g1~~TRINITY_DN5332_c0_g1_i4.p1  ORF type:complete len:545 (-),score=69.97 TRINITY_DN5332_c0_g1_i4:105-1739(-)
MMMQPHHRQGLQSPSFAPIYEYIHESNDWMRAMANDGQPEQQEGDDLHFYFGAKGHDILDFTELCIYRSWDLAVMVCLWLYFFVVPPHCHVMHPYILAPGLSIAPLKLFLLVLVTKRVVLFAQRNWFVDSGRLIVVSVMCTLCLSLALAVLSALWLSFPIVVTLYFMLHPSVQVINIALYKYDRTIDGVYALYWRIHHRREMERPSQSDHMQCSYWMKQIIPRIIILLSGSLAMDHTTCTLEYNQFLHHCVVYWLWTSLSQYVCRSKRWNGSIFITVLLTVLSYAILSRTMHTLVTVVVFDYGYHALKTSVTAPDLNQSRDELNKVYHDAQVRVIIEAEDYDRASSGDARSASIHALASKVNDAYLTLFGNIRHEVVLEALLYIDLVGFSTWAKGKSPEQVVQVHEIFKCICSELDGHEVHLIKLIGDAALCVGPIHGIANVALMLPGIVYKIKMHDGHRFQSRIGVHYGNIILIHANEVLRDVMGEAVNVCNRFETASGPGRVLCSSQFYDNAKHLFLFDHNEPMELKGCGLYDTFWLTGSRP